jgi:hypothetical protein
MTLKLTGWQSAEAEMLPEDFTHPSLRKIRFVFCDDQPNQNNEGIKYEDFAEAKLSAIGTPIKMRFEGDSAGGHASSIPIGYIKEMSEKKVGDVNQLIADGILFAEEYPEEIEYLETRFAEGTAPGLSWEVSYSSDKTLLENGVKWLKGLLTRAATFVRNPAYGNRTAILALASNRDINAKEFWSELIALASKEVNTNTDKGGNKRMDEKEAQELKDKLAAAEKALADKLAELVTLTEANTKLTTEVTTLQGTVTEREATISEFKNKELITTRLAALTAAGITLETDPEKLEKRKAFYAGLSEEAFAEYVEELKSVKAAASTNRSSASSRNTLPALPRFDGRADAEVTTLADLGSKLRGLSRTPVTTE